ncbi:hypothetical protein QFZ27_001166 [Inquilinus ginsengisoli]|jgi:hypothetical protein|uniref:hypothetical protein n=1 Tax=Inquilinus ginsengisoli TaxID=363840 RepID=UPI003D1D758D
MILPIEEDVRGIAAMSPSWIGVVEESDGSSIGVFSCSRIFWSAGMPVFHDRLAGMQAAVGFDPANHGKGSAA